MTLAWIISGMGVAGALAALIGFWHRGARPTDLGAVSHQWIAEHRLGSGHDSRN